MRAVRYPKVWLLSFIAGLSLLVVMAFLQREPSIHVVALAEAFLNVSPLPTQQALFVSPLPTPTTMPLPSRAAQAYLQHLVMTQELP